jgi:transketolase
MRLVLQPGIAQRQAFGEALAALGDDPRIVVLDGDVANSTGSSIFQDAHPDRFIQCGIGEQNMVAMAAGLATLGFVPFVSTFACFAVGRALDSIRVLVAQPSLNVKLIGGYAGLLTGMTGKTHQMFNDVAIMRSLPNMLVLAPADELEVRQVMRAIAAIDQPAYVQITREPSQQLFGDDYNFQIGEAVTLREGFDATLVSTGVQSTRVFDAAEILASRGIDVQVLHFPTIKPLDEDALVRAAEGTGYVITIEEQSIVGGLGGAVAEVLGDRCPVTLKRLGIKDRFGESGPNDRLLEKYRLSAAKVAEDVEALLRQPQTSSSVRRRNG